VPKGLEEEFEMKLNLSQTDRREVTKCWLSLFKSIGLVFCFAMSSSLGVAPSLLITAIEADENDRIKILVEGPAGDYIIESTDDLKSEGNWSDLFRRGLDGTESEIVDPFSETSLGKFYRIRVLTAADGFHITGEFAQALETGISYADLQSTFGLTFMQTDAFLPPVDDLSGAARNARVYAAAIAGLSKIAQCIRDSFEPGSQPTTGEIITALSEDLASGELDGRNSLNELIEIGTTGKTLDEYTEQDFIDKLNDIQSTMDGLHNVVFSEREGGSFSTAVPADWSDFCWGSADWQ
jgi:hypothetical protein